MFIYYFLNSVYGETSLNFEAKSFTMVRRR